MASSEAAKAASQRYYTSHRQEISDRNKKHYRENLEVMRKQGRDTARRHPETQLKRNRKIRLRAIAILGDKCVRCGFSDERALQVDHVDGGGNKERRRIGTTRVYYLVLKDSSPYQLLCANCNWIKKVENNE